jgi:hypothetical protein
VFFDAAGIRYEYEPEGFEVKWSENDIYKYLPDFYFPKFNVYGEVKPNKKKLLEDAEKISMMIDYNNSPISNGLIILGQIPHYDIFDKCNIPAFTFLWWNEGICSSLCQFIRPSGIITDLNIDRDIYDIASAPDFPSVLSNDDLLYYCCGIVKRDKNFSRWRLDKQDQNLSAKTLKKCYDKARQARFEHGETPCV